MIRYLDPKADVVFKKIFGEHPHLLISFLNAVLPLEDGGDIIKIDYLLSEHVPKIPILKRTIADVRCTDQQGKIFIVEMQINWVDSFKHRLLFEAGQAYVKQLKKGEEFHLLQPVYGLGIIAVQFDDQTANWYHHYQLVNINNPTHDIIDHLQLVFIELPKFPVKSTTDKKLKILWLRFLREINQKTTEVSADLLAIPEINEAISLSEEAAYTEDELQAYDDYWNMVSTEKTLISDTYRKGLNQGIEIGKEQGIALGIEKIAKQMLAAKVDLATIVACTGLSIDNIRILEDNIKNK